MQNKEIREAIPIGQEFIDVLNGNHKFHYVPLTRLSKILQRGIFSTAFGQRIKDPVFEELNRDSSVWTMDNPKDIFMTLPDFDRIIGIIIKTSDTPTKSMGSFASEIPIRVAPRKFLGLMIVDTLPIRDSLPGSLYRIVGNTLRKKSEIENILESLDEIKGVAESESRNILKLPIYGTSGNLYSPVRLSHKKLAKWLNGKADLAH